MATPPDITALQSSSKGKQRKYQGFNFRRRQISQGLRGITSYLGQESQAIVDDKYQLLGDLMKLAEQKAFDSSRTSSEYSSTLSREIRRIIKYGYSGESLETLLIKYKKQRNSEEGTHRDHDCFECIRRAMNLPSIETFNPMSS